MSVYGDLLLAFPEQRRTINVYKMTPQINGGWTKVDGSDITVTGIYQNTRGNMLKDSNGNLVQSAGFEFWTNTRDLDGCFTQINGRVYRFNGSTSWDWEGGYQRYSMEKVVGNDGTESINVTWNTGSNSFS